MPDNFSRAETGKLYVEPSRNQWPACLLSKAATPDPPPTPPPNNEAPQFLPLSVPTAPYSSRMSPNPKAEPPDLLKPSPHSLKPPFPPLHRPHRSPLRLWTNPYVPI